jgi:Protein of unknown function (DUF3102)
MTKRSEAQKDDARSNRLPVLASSINDHLRAANAATRRGLEHAIMGGLLLIEAKELVGHGEWLPWLQANCEIGPRQAQTYMKLARNRHKLEALKTQSDSFLTIASAEALVGRSRPERPHGLPGQLDLVGGPEVTASSYAASPAASGFPDRALFDLIADLEQVLAVIKDAETHVRKGKARNRFRASASTVRAAIAYLREQWRRSCAAADRERPR